MNEDNQKNNGPIHRLYRWFTAWAEKPQAEKALVGFTFAEGSFFPIPPDPLLIAMVFNNTKKIWRYTAITITASIIGGIVGYFIGVALFESIGQWILDTYHLHEQYISLGAQFQDNAFLTVLAAAFTPIPYKIITISAGAFKINFFSFLIASLIGRSARFVGVSALARYLGENHKEKIEQYLNLLSFLVVGILVLIVLLLG